MGEDQVVKTGIQANSRQSSSTGPSSSSSTSVGTTTSVFKQEPNLTNSDAKKLFISMSKTQSAIAAFGSRE